MKKFLLFICLSPLAVFAEEPTDSVPDDETPTELKEIVVEGANQSTSAEVSTYIPMKRAKNAAQDATSLLFHMSIPQLNVNPIDGSVKTSTGQEVSIYIDFVAADAQNLQGMRTQDVKKVEYYVNPTDPRFQGARYVVNFIMQKYEWGGYTKVTGEKNIIGSNNTDASVFSKFTYKKMTFDAYASENYRTNRHSGSVSTETFRFDDLYGQGPQTIERRSATESSRYRNNNNSFSFRALYNTDKLQITNSVYYTLNNTPRNSYISSLSFRPKINGSANSISASDSHSGTFNYNGNIFKIFSDKISFNTFIQYSNYHNDVNSQYSAGQNVDIVNNAKETSNTVGVYPKLNWMLNNIHTLFIQGGAVQTWTNINYYGSSPSKQNYSVGVFFGVLGYHVKLSKISTGINLSWMWNLSKISGLHNDQSYPYLQYYFSWAPNNKHQLYAYANYMRDIPTSSQKSPNMLQQNELMWYTGNPLLNSYGYLNPGVAYTWLPSNRWQMGGEATYVWLNDRIVNRYTPDGPDGTMLRRYLNDGNYHRAMIGASATARLFDRKLVATLRPQYWYYNTTGSYEWKKSVLTCSIELSYYFGNCYLSGYYATSEREQTQQGAIVCRYPDKYLLKFGWGNGTWNVSVCASNFFRYSWDNIHESFISPYYSFDRKSMAKAYHANFGAKVTYTFGYGKKVQRGDEIGGGSAGSSAILK